MPGRRLAPWVVVAVLLAGCAAPGGPAATPAPATVGHTDVWFMQHMAPLLWQTSSITSLTRDRITHPALARLADTVNQRGLADVDQLQRWLSQRGLAPHGHSHRRVDTRRQTDLERLSRLHGTAFDLAFLEVMTARHHTGIALAATEASQGTVPEVRLLAHRMMGEQRAQVRQMDAWRHAWTDSPAAPARATGAWRRGSRGRGARTGRR